MDCYCNTSCLNYLAKSYNVCILVLVPCFQCRGYIAEAVYNKPAALPSNCDNIIVLVHHSLRWDLIMCADAEEDDYICQILHKVDMLQEENNTFDVSAVDRSLEDIGDDTTNDMENSSDSGTVSPLTSSNSSAIEDSQVSVDDSQVSSVADSQVSEPIDGDTETLVVFQSADIKFRISGNEIGFIKIKMRRTLLYSMHNRT